MPRRPLPGKIIATWRPFRRTANRLALKPSELYLVFEQSIRRARSDIDLVAPIHDVRIIGIMQCLHYAEIKTIETFAETIV